MGYYYCPIGKENIFYFAMFIICNKNKNVKQNMSLLSKYNIDATLTKLILFCPNIFLAKNLYSKML